MRQMHLNTMIAKAVKCSYDPSLVEYMSNEIVKVIDNDQICFLEPESENEYKQKLRAIQLQKTSVLLEILKKQFDIDLKLYLDNSNLFAT